jgi:6-phosphogluconolactonase
MNGVETRVYADAGELASAAGTFIRDLIRGALEKDGAALVILSGGSTPRAAYGALAGELRESRLPLEKILWAFGDERWVPVGHADSNEGMARESLLGPLGVPEETIVSWEAGTGIPVEKAAAYGERLTATRPAVVLQGLGEDGHTASLFPGALALTPAGRAPVSMELHADAAAVWLEREKRWRLTLCPAYLNRCRTAVFLVSGDAKRRALARALAGDPALPASWVRGQETVFMVSRDALGDAPPDTRPGVRFA